MTEFREATKPAFSEPVQSYEAKLTFVMSSPREVQVTFDGGSTRLNGLDFSLEDRLRDKTITVDVSDGRILRAYDGVTVLVDNVPGVRYKINRYTVPFQDKSVKREQKTRQQHPTRNYTQGLWVAKGGLIL
jgi:hypothetical protein